MMEWRGKVCRQQFTKPNGAVQSNVALISQLVGQSSHFSGTFDSAHSPCLKNAGDEYAVNQELVRESVHLKIRSRQLKSVGMQARETADSKG
jgi:hypothetical protein